MKAPGKKALGRFVHESGKDGLVSVTDPLLIGMACLWAGFVGYASDLTLELLCFPLVIRVKQGNP